MGWTHPQCERCWVEENTSEEGTRTPVRIDVARGALNRAIALLEADTFAAADIDELREVANGSAREARVCCTCGYPTWVGIFVRRDPNTVRYPAEDDDS